MFENEFKEQARTFNVVENSPVEAVDDSLEEQLVLLYLAKEPQACSSSLRLPDSSSPELKTAFPPQMEEVFSKPGQLALWVSMI